MIEATCSTDDNVFETTLDATEWFKQASDEEITALAEIDFGGNYEADDVAIFFQKKKQGH